MALNIYHEARGEVTEGQIAVAQVTVNRAKDKRWPDTICGVVYQSKQFSWTHMIKDHKPTDDAAWKKAQVIARGRYDRQCRRSLIWCKPLSC